jgi:hypothetical protein
VQNPLLRDPLNCTLLNTLNFIVAIYAANWCLHQSRILHQSRLTYVWAERGSRPRAPRNQRYDWADLFGAVCPARGVGAVPVLPTVNTKAMNLPLAEISAMVALGAHAIMTLDGTRQTASSSCQTISACCPCPRIRPN